MVSHKFAVGDRVELMVDKYAGDVPPGIYTISRRLPVEAQYVPVPASSTPRTATSAWCRKARWLPHPACGADRAGAQLSSSVSQYR